MNPPVIPPGTFLLVGIMEIYFCNALYDVGSAALVAIPAPRRGAAKSKDSVTPK